jgi:cell division protein FtsB
VRDKDIVELAAKVTERESKLNDLYDENQYLREKANVPPEQTIDLKELRQYLHSNSSKFNSHLLFFRIKEKMEMEQLRALNKQLEEEIRELEEERLRLKGQLRFSALGDGERAVKLGLTHDELVAVDRYASKLKNKNGGMALRFPSVATISFR